MRQLAPRQSSLRLLACVDVTSASWRRTAVPEADPSSLNRSGRIEWFRDQGFGLLIHWSVDRQIGGLTSHSLVGASAGHRRRFLEEPPRTFSPRKVNPKEWIAPAKLASDRTYDIRAVVKQPLLSLCGRELRRRAP